MWTRTPDPSQLSLLSYNVLMKEVRPHWHPYCPEAFIDWSYRRNGIEATVRAAGADIVCLQELSALGGEVELDTSLRNLGYDFMYSCRLTNHGKSSSSHGVALCVKKRPGLSVVRWHCLPFAMAMESYDPSGSFRADQQVAIAAEVNFNGTTIFIVGVHLTTVTRDDRLRQLAQVGLLMKSLPRGVPVVVCGDFNVTHTSEPYTVLTSGLQEKIVSGLPIPLFENLPCMQSAYKTVLGSEPEYTNFRGSPEPFRGVLDYIMYSSGAADGAPLTPVAVLHVPKVETTSPAGIPDQYYPSDHLPIGAVFAVTPTEGGDSAAPVVTLPPQWCALTGHIILPSLPKPETMVHWSDGECTAPRCRTVFINKLPHSIEHKDEVRSEMKKYGDVTHVHVRHDANTGQSLRMAFVSFQSELDVHNVLLASRARMLIVKGQSVLAAQRN